MRKRLVVAALSILAFGCDGKKKNGGDDGPALTVEDTLTRLGVDISTTPRREPDGTGDLPAGYTPFGATAEINRIDELFSVGIGVRDPANTTVTLPRRVHVIEKDAGPTTVLHSPAADPVWFDENVADGRDWAQSERAAVAADVDNDGKDEAIVVYVDLEDPAHDEELTIVVKDDEVSATPFADTTTVVHLEANIRDVTVAAADFNGDGRDELAIGLDTPAGAKLLFLTNTTAGGLVVNTAATQTFPPATAGNLQTIMMAAGHLDYDAGQELVVVVNEFIDNGALDSGLATFYLYDDSAAQHAEVTTGPIQGTDGAVHTAIVSDVDVGDFDGDGMEEILFGGLTAYTDNCDMIEYLAVVMEGPTSAFAKTTNRYSDFNSQCDQANVWYERWVHANAVDLDGDLQDEVSLNRHVFDGVLAPLYEIGESAIYPNGQSVFNRSTSAIAIGDLSGDGMQDIIVFSQAVPELAAFGDHQINGFSKVASIATESANTQDPISPLLAAVNVDEDTAVLKYSEATYKLVFTEPVVLAALAAAPCAEGIGQNTDGCGTTFGTAVTGTTTIDQVLSVTASVSVGVNIDGGVFTQSELSLKGTLSTRASFITGNAYSLTQSVVYSTGPLEDSVIFTTIPYDTWTYTVISHPDPEMVGQPTTVSMPREPLTLIADREFFNASLTTDESPVGPQVFQHVIGDLASYPTVSEKDALRAQHGGIQSNAQAVGQGTSTTELGLAVGTEYTVGSALELGFEFELEATVATVMAGFSVGASAERSLTVTSGTETSYTGVVGSIDAEHFADNVYSFGLFTYVFPDPVSGQEFEVVNYWVE